MVFECFHHVFGTVEVALQKQKIIGKCSAHLTVVTHTVAFNIYFADNIDSIFVGKAVEKFRLRIMACTCRIYIIFSKKLKIFPHEFLSYIMSCFFVVLMNIHSFNKYRFTVYFELFVFDFRYSESDFLRCSLYSFSVSVFQLDNECI
ncbi:MAG: hypothetical protein BWZ00_01818 [Bacteroidetes bacterium ADurb.BinA174]|nr:MAG: hypothetical protein BWZ00_01818 [Bacteroidetes bacterium ADurb.BinA174]